MFGHSFNPKFPIRQFLQQPVFDPNTQLILNPRQFQKQYQIELLERCLTLTREDNNRYSS